MVEIKFSVLIQMNSLLMFVLVHIADDFLSSRHPIVVRVLQEENKGCFVHLERCIAL